MSTEVDEEFIRDTYRKMSDQELVIYLTQHSAGLTPEAMKIVREEVARRNLDGDITAGVEAQQRSYTAEEIDSLCELIRMLPCPVTGNTSQPLNATMTAQVMSFIFFTSYKKSIIVASPQVLDRANNKALVRTLLLGWWGIPWGIIRTIEAIVINIRSKRSLRVEGPNNYLRSFVLTKIGEIEAYKRDREKLLSVISAGL
jgi:hypothetical protein